jgi:hypothetical protein
MVYSFKTKAQMGKGTIGKNESVASKPASTTQEGGKNEKGLWKAYEALNKNIKI